MALEQVTDGVWVVPAEVKVGPGFFLPARATVVRLEDGGLWVHSPVALTEDTAEEIDGLGPVRELVAPNNLHHLFIGDWKAKWPNARMVGARGLRKKRADLAFDETLDTDVSWPGIDRVFIEGAPAWGETVFFHASTQTLICTDLLFNMGPHNTRGFLTPWILRMGGAWRRPMQSRLIRTVTKDRARAGASVEQVLQWPIERVIMAHGAIIEDDAVPTLRSALYWMLEGKTPATAELTA